MKLEALLFILAAATPLVGYFVCRNPLFRLALSVLGTVAFMSGCLILGESRAQNPDFDLIFGTALLGWNVLAVAYVIVCFVVMSAAADLFRRICQNSLV